MPTNGSISHRILNESLAGHPGTRTLELVFNFTPGVQGPEHPHPGLRYNIVGFPRMVRSS
jgi:deltex-like protein